MTISYFLNVSEISKYFKKYPGISGKARLPEFETNISLHARPNSSR